MRCLVGLSGSVVGNLGAERRGRGDTMLWLSAVLLDTSTLSSVEIFAGVAACCFGASHLLRLDGALRSVALAVAWLMLADA